MKSNNLSLYLEVQPQVFVEFLRDANCPLRVHWIEGEEHPTYSLIPTDKYITGSLHLHSLDSGSLDGLLHTYATEQLKFAPVSRIDYNYFDGSKEQVRGLNSVINYLSKKRLAYYATFIDDKGNEQLIFGRNPNNSATIEDRANVKDYLGFE